MGGATGLMFLSFYRDGAMALAMKSDDFSIISRYSVASKNSEAGVNDFLA